MEGCIPGCRMEGDIDGKKDGMVYWQKKGWSGVLTEKRMKGCIPGCREVLTDRRIEECIDGWKEVLTNQRMEDCIGG